MKESELFALYRIVDGMTYEIYIYIYGWWLMDDFRPMS